METTILYGQAQVEGICTLVEVVKMNERTAIVRRCYRGIPVGKTFKRHVQKHFVRVHGKNVIRRDYMEKGCHNVRDQRNF